MEEKKEIINLVSLKFDNAKIPESREIKGKQYIRWGDANDYPQFLLNIYQRSALHKAIVDSKVTYISGKGLIIKEGYSNPLIENANESETLYDIIKKCIMDIELFDGFYLKLNMNANDEIAAIQHINFSEIRSNKDNTEFYYSDKWLTDYGTENPRPEYQTYSAYGINNEKEVIFYYKKYSPFPSIYPSAPYIGGIPSIITDIQIANFHKNAIEKGFKGGTMIVFKNGIPSQEEMRSTEAKLKSKFSNTDDANSIVIDFVDDPNLVPEIISLTPNNFDKQYEELTLSVDKKIAQSHRIPSLMLFAERVSGQLGGRSELIDAYQLLNVNYIHPAQNTIEMVFNSLLGEPYAITIEKLTFLQREFSEQTLLQVLTKNEIREMLGKEPILDTTGSTISIETMKDIEEVYTMSKTEEMVDTLLSLNPKLTKEDLMTMTKLGVNEINNILNRIKK